MHHHLILEVDYLWLADVEEWQQCTVILLTYVLPEVSGRYRKPYLIGLWPDSAVHFSYLFCNNYNLYGKIIQITIINLGCIAALMLLGSDSVIQTLWCWCSSCYTDRNHCKSTLKCFYMDSRESGTGEKVCARLPALYLEPWMPKQGGKALSNTQMWGGWWGGRE